MGRLIAWGIDKQMHRYEAHPDSAIIRSSLRPRPRYVGEPVLGFAPRPVPPNVIDARAREGTMYKAAAFAAAILVSLALTPQASSALEPQTV
jgi:hypothetical protein